MITVIARHEFTATLRDGRFRLCAALVGLLLAAALLAGWSFQRDLAARRAAAVRHEHAHWIGQPDKNPHSAAHYGLHVFKPRLSPALLDPGIEPYVGSVVWLEAHNQNDFTGKPAEDATAAQRFGELTAVLVLQLLLPLLIIVNCFGTVAGERERGTLRQVFALGVSPARWLLGKMFGQAAALTLAVVPAVVVGSLAVWLAREGTLTSGTWLRLVLFAAVHLVYLAVFWPAHWQSRRSLEPRVPRLSSCSDYGRSTACCCRAPPSSWPRGFIR
ncbi:ABC transporter permease [Termitidicoccus mucosus]|uniref:ABC transporter permease n=1 Tax=Termitidicoccus mucosus TaxID=1184151 RepID=UPI0031832D46